MKISNAVSGEKNPFYGKHHSEEFKKRLKLRFKKENHPFWRGGCKGYKHKFIKEIKGKASQYLCEICKKRKAHGWSNRDHKYREDIKDYRALCMSCHEKWDYKYNNRTRSFRNKI